MSLTTFKNLIPLLLLATTRLVLAAAPVSTSDNPASPGLRLAHDGSAAPLLLDPADFKVTRIAAECLAADIQLVAGVKPAVLAPDSPLPESLVIIGTLGKSAPIDRLVSEKKINPAAIAGKWEATLFATVDDPLPGVKKALVIVGSDRRGTAYGAFALSEAIGVSPWVWWADVPPQKRPSLIVDPAPGTLPTPSVRYRGIFINDEDWGMKPWSAKTLEPETGDIGPKTYARVAELLLRLRANLLWPAMHECTGAFNSIPENKIVMDDYAIVMGSSHAEPMLYNNATEWTLPKDAWNYEKDPAPIRAVWEKRLSENGRYENLYTVGIRGIHDRPMQGGATIAAKATLLESAITDQRAILARYTGKPAEKVPQVFVPYKEVLPIYQNGMNLPSDITLMWVDDNHGYIRRLSTPAESERSGGSGVYYHHSYWGAPEDYLWLGTTPIALTWEEMRKAYTNGANRVWVLNVGDIKPMEIGMEFFLRMASDIGKWSHGSQPAFLRQWANQNFPGPVANEIATLMDSYYRLNYQARPEHLNKVTFTNNYGEIDTRLTRFAKLAELGASLHQLLPPERRDAFYEMVLYPVRGSALANEINLSPDPAKALAAWTRLQEETKTFNETIAGGKWRHMMSSNPRKRPALLKPDPARAPRPPADPPDTTSIALEAENPTRSTDREQTATGRATYPAWVRIPGLGRSGEGSITLVPPWPVAPTGAFLEYDFTAPRAGPLKVHVDCIPTHPLNGDFKLRYTATIDDGPPQEIDLSAAEYSKQWAANVVSATATGITTHDLDKPGKHTLTLRPLDPSLIFDKITLDFGDLRPSHLGPPP